MADIIGFAEKAILSVTLPRPRAHVRAWGRVAGRAGLLEAQLARKDASGTMGCHEFALRVMGEMNASKSPLSTLSGGHL
jgi:hypothetical protein